MSAEPAGTRAKPHWPIILGAFAVGFGLLGAALAVFNTRSTSPLAIWGGNTLITVGGAVLLVVPFEWITGRLSRRVEEVHDEVGVVRQDTSSAVRAVEQETRQRVAEVRDEVEDVKRQVSSLTDYADRVAQGLQEEKDEDLRAYRALGEAEPTREALLDAMRRATRRGIPSERFGGVRAEMHEGHDDYILLAYRAETDFDKEGIFFHLVEVGGLQISSVEWRADASAEEVTRELARALDAAGREGQLTANDLTRWWSRIAETLVVGASHPKRRKIIEVCPPQWVVTDDGVGPYPDRPLRFMPGAQVRSDSSIQAVAQWPWVHFDSFDKAAAVWVMLFGKTDPWDMPGPF